MSDYTQTLNTLERMDLNDPVPVEILPPAIQDLLVVAIGGDLDLDVPLDPDLMNVSEALQLLLRDWGTVPNVIHGLNGPDTFFDTWSAEQALICAWLTDNGIDPASVCIEPMYFDHTNNVLTYAEWCDIPEGCSRTEGKVKRMTQHTMQDAPIASLLPTY